MIPSPLLYLSFIKAPTARGWLSKFSVQGDQTANSTVTVGEHSGGLDDRVIALQALAKALQVMNTTGQTFCQPEVFLS